MVARAVLAMLAMANVLIQMSAAARVAGVGRENPFVRTLKQTLVLLVVTELGEMENVLIRATAVPHGDFVETPLSFVFFGNIEIVVDTFYRDLSCLNSCQTFGTCTCA
mmetsp:Transcript_13090/g.16524  ORF Transcript_13090/g.16524 Transcript_13090/m.16524 type:complete len:108 (+) Transcript_13090:1157-1480(+)